MGYSEEQIDQLRLSIARMTGYLQALAQNIDNLLENAPSSSARALLDGSPEKLRKFVEELRMFY